jgi:hypothetical protein
MIKILKDKIKKHKRKLLVFLISFIVVSIIFSSLSKNVKAVDNYTNYLYNQPITIVNDRAMILNEGGAGTNNYRNYFDSGFTFPAKLSNEMFNAFSDDYSQYSLSQIYLDNLDNDLAFKSNNPSENAVYQNYTNTANFNVNNGSLLRSIDFYESNQTFEFDDIGSNPSGWSIDETGGNVNVIKESNEHSNVVELYDTSATQKIAVSYQLDNYQNFGTFEYWIKSNDTSQRTYYTIYGWSGAWLESIGIMMYGNYLQRWQGAQTYNLAPIVDDTWYHIRIDYDSTTGGYLGLDQWKYSIYIDTVLIGTYSFSGNTGNIGLFSANSYFVGTTNCKFYIDSIDFTNDNDYKYFRSYNYINNYSLYIPELYGLIGHYKAEHSFTNEVGQTETSISFVDISNTGTNCLASVVSSIDDYNHVLELSDDSGTARADIEHSFSSSKATGAIEFYFHTTDATKEFDMRVYDGYPTYSNGIDLYFGAPANKIAYNDGSFHNIYHTLTDDTTYHIRIEYDLTTDWHFWLDGISLDGGSGYAFRGSPTAIDGIHFQTDTSANSFDVYIDAVDTDDGAGYYTNRNYESGYYYLEIEKEINIEYMSDSNFKPVFLDVYGYHCFNLSNTISAYIYNYDSETYSYIYENSRVNEFTITESFRFNESGQYRFNKFKIKFISLQLESNFGFYLNKLFLNITYIKTNENGFHDLSIKISKQKDDTTYTGYSIFEMEISDNYFLYRYSEINDFADNYVENWINISYSSIETFEVNLHIRYGLNTLDVEISNILVEIYVDSINVLSFLEQDRKYFLGTHYNPSYNYTCNNRNYLNLTGVVGNYSYNCLKGIRVLSGLNSQIYNRFFNVPLFQQNIDVSQRAITQTDLTIEDEPDAPKGASYWSYTSFRLISGTAFDTQVGNWSINFQPVEVEGYEAKYYYYPEYLAKDALGNWKIKISDDIYISFNWFRDAFTYILNLIILFFQFLGYLIIASLSFMFMFLGCYIVAFLYNICVYYIFIGLCYVVWFLWLVLLYCWQYLWLFLSWCYNVLLPLLIEALIIVIAFLLTVFVYILTLGTIDFWETYDLIYDVLWYIVDFVVIWFNIFANNLDSILIFIVLYLLNCSFLGFHYLYARIRGYKDKSKRLQYTFLILIFPFVFIWNLLTKLLEGTPEL